MAAGLEGWGAQAGPGLQRAGRLWVWGKSLSKGPKGQALSLAQSPFCYSRQVFE